MICMLTPQRTCRIQGTAGKAVQILARMMTMQTTMTMVPCGHGRPPDARGWLGMFCPHLVSAQAQGSPWKQWLLWGGDGWFWVPPWKGQNPPRDETPGKWTLGLVRRQGGRRLFSEIPAVAPKEKVQGCLRHLPRASTDFPSFHQSTCWPWWCRFYSLPGAMIVDSSPQRVYFVYEDRGCLILPSGFPVPDCRLGAWEGKRNWQEGVFEKLYKKCLLCPVGHCISSATSPFYRRGNWG